MGEYNNRMSVFVASPDSYADVLSVFVQCFKKFCAECPYELILATNTTSYEGVRMIHNGKKTDTWVERVIPALRQISSKYILLMNDDTFITRPIGYEKIEMILNDMDAYQLNFCGLSNRFPGKKVHPESKLVYVNKQTPYAKNLRVGIYNREYLLELLGEGNLSGWDLECRWIQEAYKAPDEYFSDIVSCTEKVVVYIHAVAKGMWFPTAISRIKKLGFDVTGERKNMLFVSELKIYFISKAGKLFSARLRKKIKKILSGIGIKFVTEG